MSYQSLLGAYTAHMKRLSAIFVFGSMLLLSACGGGGSSSGGNPPPPAVVLKGTAAGGFPIAGYVSVKGASGNTAGPSPIQVDGSYSVDVTTLTAPYMVYAEGTVNGKTVRYYSAATSAGNLNITSVTDYIVRNALNGTDPNTAYAGFNSSTITSANLAAAEQLAQQQLATVMQAVNGTVPNLLTTSFAANQSGFDQLLDAVTFSYTGTSATLTNTLNSSILTTDTSTGNATGDLGTVTSMQAALTDEAAIATIFQTFNNLNANTTAATYAADMQAFMNAYAAPGFLNNGQDATQFVSDLVVDPLPAGFTVTPILAGPITVNGYTKAYAVDVIMSAPGIAGTEVDRHQMVYDSANSKWLWLGNQYWLSVEFNARSQIFYPASGTPTIQSSIHAWFEDRTGYATSTKGVNSIIVTGAGLPSGGLILAYQAPNTVFQIVSANNSQFGSQEYALTDSQLAAIPDNSVYTISLYAELAANVSTQSTPLVSYNVTLPKAAAQGLTAADFPKVVSPSDHLLSTLNLPGKFNISWSNPAQASAEYVSLSTQDASNWNEYGNNVLSTDTSTTIDATALNYTPTMGYFWINSKDAYKRDYATLWELNAGTPPPPPPPPPALTCNTASTYDANNNPLTFFTFAEYETIVGDCGTAMTFDATMFAGKSFTLNGNTLVFNADGTGTNTDPNVPTFTWTVEQAAGGYSYVVANYSCAAAQCGIDITFRDTVAVVGVTGTPGTSGATYDLRWYSEASTYPNSDMVRATGADATVDNADQLVEQ